MDTYDLEGFSQQAKTRVAVAHMFLPVHAHMCSTGASCSLMGPRWLIYPILSMDSAKCRIGPFHTVIFLTPKKIAETCRYRHSLTLFLLTILAINHLMPLISRVFPFSLPMKLMISFRKKIIIIILR